MSKRLIGFLSTLATLACVAVGLIVTNGKQPVTSDNSPVTSAASPSATSFAPPTSSAMTATSTVQTNASVVRVVDGDTLVAKLDSESKEWTVRLLGINTPETVDPRKAVECFGKEASQKSHSLLDGKRIRLEADPQADELDKYGRLLRNVILEDGTDVNALLVREGYAHAYLSFPLNAERKRELRQLENEAKASLVGLWSSQACPG